MKHTVAPEVTRSMRVALQDLALDRLDVIHIGTDTYPLGERVRAVAFDRLQQDVTPLPGLALCGKVMHDDVV